MSQSPLLSADFSAIDAGFAQGRAKAEAAATRASAEQAKRDQAEADRIQRVNAARPYYEEAVQFFRAAFAELNKRVDGKLGLVETPTGSEEVTFHLHSLRYETGYSRDDGHDWVSTGFKPVKVVVELQKKDGFEWQKEDRVGAKVSLFGDCGSPLTLRLGMKDAATDSEVRQRILTHVATAAGKQLAK